MSQRTILYGLLGVVAAAAAVLSFSALRDLAVTCGFDERLAWLLPIVIDAGAAAGSLAWLGSAAPAGRSYGRILALLLLASSVGGNALGHGLAAYAARPHWGVVVAVSAVAPVVLGALVHLAVVSAQRPTARPELVAEVDEEPIPYELTADAHDAGLLDERGLSRLWETAAAVRAEEEVEDRAAELIADGVGRRRLARELGVTEYQARQLLAGHRTNGHGATS